MSKQRLRVKDSRFETVDTIPCAVIVCKNGAEIAVPAEAFLVLAAKARQFLNSANVNPVVGQWSPARFQEVNQIRTGTTDTGRIALQLNPGTGTEICISLDPKTAQELGHKLIELPAPPSYLAKSN